MSDTHTHTGGGGDSPQTPRHQTHKRFDMKQLLPAFYCPTDRSTAVASQQSACCWKPPQQQEMKSASRSAQKFSEDRSWWKTVRIQSGAAEAQTGTGSKVLTRFQCQHVDKILRAPHSSLLTPPTIFAPIGRSDMLMTTSTLAGVACWNQFLRVQAADWPVSPHFVVPCGFRWVLAACNMLSVVVEMKMSLSANHANSEATSQHTVAASALQHRSIQRARSRVSF